jgi:predicted transcriptional regulator
VRSNADRRAQTFELSHSAGVNSDACSHPLNLKQLVNHLFTALAGRHEQVPALARDRLTCSIGNPISRAQLTSNREAIMTDSEDDALTWRHTYIAADIVSANVSHNAVQPTMVPQLVQQVFDALGSITTPKAVVPDKPQPAVPIRKSVTPEALVCLEDGRKYTSLKRHLHAVHRLTPEQYRQRWGLPKDYPMVTPNYAAARSALATSIGLGRSSGVKPVAAKPLPK